jgi:hypothetical protein
MRHRGFLRLADVLQQRAGGADGKRQLIGTESSEIERPQLIGQEARGTGEFKMPGWSGAHHALVAGEILRGQVI